MGNPNGTYFRLIVDNADNFFGPIIDIFSFFSFSPHFPATLPMFHASDFPHSFSYANRTRL